MPGTVVSVKRSPTLNGMVSRTGQHAADRLLYARQQPAEWFQIENGLSTQHGLVLWRVLLEDNCEFIAYSKECALEYQHGPAIAVGQCSSGMGSVWAQSCFPNGANGLIPCAELR